MDETARPADRHRSRPRRCRVPDTRRPPASGGRAAALVLFLGTAGAALPDAVDAQIGVMGGYSRDSLGELDAGEGFALADQADGFHTGIFLDIGLGRFAIRPGIVYRHLQDAALSGPERTSADIEIVEFPLDLRLGVPLPVATPYLLAGPVLMFPSSARSSIDQALADPRVRLEIGVGLEWDVGFRLWPEIRYGKGLGGLAGSAAEAASGESSSLETLTIRLGVSF